MKLFLKSTKQDTFDSELSLRLESEDGMIVMTFHSELVKSLRRSISRLISKKALPARLAMLASLRQEGTTFLSRALATTLANDLDASVCAVELNWWWPEQTWAAISGNAGLAAVLTERIKLKDAIIRTNRPNLTILPAGNLAVSDRPVFARSSLLKEILYQLNEQYKYLILDIPTILATNDTIPLASLGDACCLVIQQGITPIEKVRTALDEVDQLKLLGVILNKARTTTPSFLQNLLSSASSAEANISSSQI